MIGVAYAPHPSCICLEEVLVRVPAGGGAATEPHHNHLDIITHPRSRFGPNSPYDDKDLDCYRPGYA